MFLDEKAYKYEPIYDNWREANSPDYWQYRKYINYTLNILQTTAILSKSLRLCNNLLQSFIYLHCIYL